MIPELLLISIPCVIALLVVKSQDNERKPNKPTVQQKRMMKKAMLKYHGIYICGNSISHLDNFTVQGNQLLFWFNDKTGSTHIIKEEVE